jgi:hypothetical protein
MSLRNLVFVSLLVLPLGLCKAQPATAKPVEPKAIGVVYRLDPTSQELKKLPDEQWHEKPGPWPHSYDTYLELNGGHSSFRMKAGEKIEFVFNTGSPEKVSLYRFILKKDKRQFQAASATWTGYQGIKGLPVEVSKYGESSYQLVPASQLDSGEYAVIIAGEFFTFGID